MSRLDGRTVVLTGAAGGIGSLVAARMQALGASIVGVDRIPCPACDQHIVADLANAEDLAALAERLTVFPVDILVNVAGLQYFGPFEDQPAMALRTGYLVNLVAPATLISAVLPAMRARGAGQIVNIGSVMGTVNYPFFAAYSSAKAGLRGLSEALRREVQADAVAVTYIAPRAVRTAFNSAAVTTFMTMTGMRADDPESVADRIVAAIVARRKDVSIGVMETFFMRLNSLFPRLVDVGLAGQAAQARRLFLR
uniref:SDR family NAD(P)-dependent oxidoreductase n=1 Tax=uncultured Sphingomonas sp. TaxID=158754 RepID=UPI0035C9DB68